MEIIKTYKTTDWSGGKTTEMYIFPKDCSYNERNFDFRISSATIEVEESEFTDLIGYQRLLTILDGELELKVNDKPVFKLKEDVPFYFLGSDKVTARGKVRDFNVIFSPKYNIEWSLINKDEVREIKSNEVYVIYFLVKGEVKINDQLIKDNELIVIDKNEKKELQHIIFSQMESRLYEVVIQLNN